MLISCPFFCQGKCHRPVTSSTRPPEIVQIVQKVQLQRSKPVKPKRKPKEEPFKQASMDSSFVAASHFPAIYKVPLTVSSELIALYAEILKDAVVDEVPARLSQYVNELIEPVDWKAIWRPTENSSALNFPSDFVVAVNDVAHTGLTADVVILEILTPDASIITSKQIEEIENLKQQKKISVPLTELHVISAEDTYQQFARTAIVIEHVRFFYKNVWRAWDGVIGSAPANDIFIEGRLEPRLNLYSDIQQKSVPESTVNKIKCFLKEGWNVREQLDGLESALASLSETDMEDKLTDEADIHEGMGLRLRLEDIAREMKLLEDPHLRSVASTRSPLFMRDDDLYSSDGRRRCHIVSKTCLSKDLQFIASKLEVSHHFVNVF